MKSMFSIFSKKRQESIHPTKIMKNITNHPAHPKHTLKLEYTETPFNCHGCDEAGIGYKYKCSRRRCNYELHEFCGTALLISNHFLFKECRFQFNYHPLAGENMRTCDACGTNIRGFGYRDDHLKKDLHPCCANLPQVLNDGERFLNLSKKISGPCHRCRHRKGPGWAYTSRCKAYNLHVSCAKKLVVENWKDSYFNVDKKKKTELQTKIPTLNGSPEGNLTGARGDTVKKCGQFAAAATRLVVSAILGNLTAVLGGV